MSEIILDGDRCILGRLASYAVKQTLQGNSIAILNCEKVFITGNKQDILERYLKKRARGKSGKMKGPLFPTSPDKIMRRTIRGMMKYKEGRFKPAFKKIKCYNGVPEEYQKAEKSSICKVEDGKKGISLGELSRLLKGGSSCLLYTSPSPRDS